MPLQSIDSRTLPIRRKIVHIAKGAADSGAHYLTEAAGAMPGESDPWRRRRIDLRESMEWESLGIHTAEYRAARGNRGFLGCAGRYRRAGGLEINRQVEPRVRAYIEANRERPLAEWPQFEGMGYPRRAWNQFTRRHEYVLGEDCRGKRHFDCIQFVNWVLSTVLQRAVTYSETQWISVGPVTRVPAPSNAELLAPGDMVVRIGGEINHMAIVGDGHMLIEAAGAAAGVIVDPYRPGSYTDHIRLTNRYLLQNGAHLLD